jgi:predicted ATPase
MILSITFNKNTESGYIYKPVYKKVLKKQFADWTPEQIDTYIESEIKRTGSRYCLGRNPYEYFYYERKCGYENPHLIKNLGGKTIKFEPNKINVIFGPNGCGKTTIIKALANSTLCGDRHSLDGYTNIYHIEPLDMNGNIIDESTYDLDNYTNTLLRYKNDVTIEWDGHPVYFENISGRRSTGALGEMVGSLFTSDREEFMWLYSKSRMSLGQNTIYMIDKLIKVCEQCPTIDSFVKEVNKKQHSVPWFYVGNCALDYIRSFYKEDGNMTLLLDECDKSLDISNTVMLYKDLLPALRKKYNMQIILVSHSPLMLSNIIQNSPDYNFISIDKQYTKEMKALFNGIMF